MNPILQVQSITKRFHHRPALKNLFGREQSGVTVALNDVSFEASASEVIALLGPNGSGKTTLFKIIAGMLLPDSGIVKFGNTSGGDSHRSISMAVASERSFFPRLTARENLDYFAALENIPRDTRPKEISRTLEIVDLAAKSDMLVQKFSSGMYQRLAIARALLRRPALLLLDEPTRSLDPAASEMLWEWIRRDASSHATILIATHNFAEAAAVARKAIILSSGQVVATRTAIAAEELRNYYFSVVPPSPAAAETSTAGAR